MVKKPKKIIKKVPSQPVGGGAGTERVKKTKVMVIGIGGGGGSIVSEIAPRMKKASFVAANTDRQALKKITRKVSRFQFGQNLTQGLGTGMNVELGQVAAENEKEKIKNLLKNHDFCVLVASLGGGTSSGAAPVFAKAAKNLGVLTYGIFTLPFKFEGEKKMEIAKSSLEKLKPKLNALLVIPNERIFQIINKKTPLKSALSLINKNLAESLGGLIEMIYQPGLINIDFADLKTILQGQGRLAYLNTIEVQGSHRGEEIVKKVISNPLYPYSIRGAKGVLFNIVGEKNLTLSEVAQLSKNIYELINEDAKVIFGIGQQKRLKNKIKVTLLATGCGTRIFPIKIQKKRLRKKPIKKQPQLKISPSPKQPKKIKRKPRKKSLGQQRKKKSKIVKRRKIKPKRRFKSKKTKVKVKISQESKENQIQSNAETKVRKNALQIKKEAEAEEAEMLAKEKFWETPAFLRRENK